MTDRITAILDVLRAAESWDKTRAYSFMEGSTLLAEASAKLGGAIDILRSADPPDLAKMVEAELPCTQGIDADPYDHPTSCPAYYRPAVTQLIQAAVADQQDKFEAHTKAVQQFLGEIAEIISLDASGLPMGNVQEACASILLALTAIRQRMAEQVEQIADLVGFTG